MTPDVLLVGHITKDLTNDGWRPGGSVLYAAAQCRRLGLNVAAVTACGPEIEPQALMPDVQWHVVRDTTSTTFENRYADGRRTQQLIDRARQLELDDIPEGWQAAPIVLLMPVFHDVDPDIVSAFACSATLLGASVQGWLRQLDITMVQPAQDRPSARAWQGTDVVFVSDEDVQDAESVEQWSRYIPTIALTRGTQGTTLWHEGTRHDLPALPVNEVDPTGAGDVFAAAFMVRLQQAGNAVEAARFASAAAALAVQGRGTEAIGDRDAIERLARGAPVSR
jgi:sugar/nucleoside kinase (ribokinase family)